MARPGRKRKIDAPRFPNGQAKPPDQTPSPILVKRLAAYSLAGMQDPQWGTIPGVFYLSRKIDEVEYETAKRFGDLYSQYTRVLNGPRKPKTSTGEPSSVSGHIDVDTDAGQKEANWHINVIQKYNDAHITLYALGSEIENEVMRFCIDSGQTPVGWEGFIRLRKGLAALSGLWEIKTKG
jgi:hypothetical protein